MLVNIDKERDLVIVSMTMKEFLDMDENQKIKIVFPDGRTEWI